MILGFESFLITFLSTSVHVIVYLFSNKLLNCNNELSETVLLVERDYYY